MKATSLACALTAVSSLLVGPAAGASVQRPDAPVGPPVAPYGTCRITRVFSPDLARVEGHAPHFPATRVVGIEFEMLPSHLPAGAHTLELQLYAPEGHLYQALPARFTVERPGHGHVREQPAAEPLRVRLSVPGSPIVTHGLYGHWEARPYLDGAAEPCGKAQDFWLEADRGGGRQRDRTRPAR
jgi:hypothetical protein